MPIRDLQQRLTQVGVIRLGEQRISQNNKSYPAKLETFRITSPSQQLIEAVAELLGGQPRPWQSPTGPQFEVITKATEIAVHVPPQIIDPNYELWGNKFRARLCDGETERIRNCPCLCEAAAQQRYAQRGIPWPENGQFERTTGDCKPTTRLSLMISDIPSGVGTFKLESHGWNAAAELPTLAASIAAATQPIPALLRLEQRESNKLAIVGGQEKVEPRKYAVPVLDFFGLFSPRQAFSGELNAAVRTAVGSGPERQAIGAAPENPPADREQPARPAPAGRQQPAEPEQGVDWRAEIAKAKTPAILNRLKAQMQRAGVKDKALVEAWMARKAEIDGPARQPQQQPAQQPAPAEAAAEPADDDVVDAEIVDEDEPIPAAQPTGPEPDMDALWTQIMKAGKARGLNLPAIEERYRTVMGHDPTEEAANGWKYQEFLEHLQMGEVQS